MADDNNQKSNERAKGPDFTISPFVFPSTENTDTASITKLGSGYITALLGKGGMANVYEIWNPELEIHRAVKLIHPTASDIDKERFETEMKITAKLHHPHIVEIHGVGKWNGLSYIEMEKLDGKTLREYIVDRGALPIPVCTSIGLMICEALKHAHEMEYVLYGEEYHGIIHRDLKPSNIMICNSGSVKLMDFGIARPVHASFHTIDGTVVGTIHYLPPEQLKGEQLDQRTDIYALAATLYEIITGSRAFPEKNLSKLMAEKTKNRYKPLDEFEIEVPGELIGVIHRCMHYNPDKRITTAQKLHERLKKIHYRLTADSPQDVIKSFIKTRFNVKITPSLRSNYIRKLASAAMLCAGIGIISYASYHLYSVFLKKTAALSGSRQVLNTPSGNADPLAEYRAKINEKAPSQEQKTSADRHTTQKVQAAAASVPAHRTPQPASLSEKYGVSDLSDVLEIAYNRHNYADVIEACNQLPEAKKTSPKCLIYKMRTYSKQNNIIALNTFLNSSSLNDGEFFLEKAKQAYLNGDIQAAQAYLGKSVQLPCAFLDREELMLNVSYYTALCETQKFINTRSDQSFNSAMESWYQVKAALKKNQEHPFYRKATTEMQKIGTLFREQKKNPNN